VAGGLAGELREGAARYTAAILMTAFSAAASPPISALQPATAGAPSRARQAVGAGLTLALCAGILGAQGSGGVNTPAQQKKPYVILISFDGFKPGYLQRVDLPNFNRVIQRGVRSTGMIPVYPSKTFPNHYSIVTGMYAESHGVVGNRFWDATRNANYSMSDTTAVLDGTWYRGEPIWVTAERQGMVAASYFWVASEAAIGGVRPTFTKKYDGRVSNANRVDSVLAWLALPAERRPHMVTMYFSDTDGAAHDHGPLSPELDIAAQRVDATLGRLMAGLDALPDVKDRVYLVLVSDHGMAETSPRWYVGLDTVIAMDSVRLGEAGTLANLYVTDAPKRARIIADSINRRMKFGRAYLRSDVPEHLHYRKDPRAGDVIVVMSEHWQIGMANRPARAGGNHGWDPTFPSMHALFVASGPGIAAGKVIPPFENVDLYPWLSELLGLKAAPGIDGKPGRLAKLIR
jgi:predicted AlkP superfamily pyrophosphatase or phosphodiesterase